MTLFFSPMTMGFYDDVMKDDYESVGAWPDDLIKLSKSNYNALLTGQSEGKSIVQDKYGIPVLGEFTAGGNEMTISEAEEKKHTLIREAKNIITPLEYAIELNIITNKELKRLRLWKEYRVLLDRIDPKRASEIEWPQKPVMN